MGGMKNSLTELAGTTGLWPAKNFATGWMAVLELKNWIYRLQFAKRSVTFAAVPQNGS